MNDKKSDIFLIENNGVTEVYQVHTATNKFCERINEKIRSEFGVIEEIIKHQPSIGNYYEKILSNSILEYLPSMWKIGTGFIFDDQKNKSSPQIDILVYDDQKISPIFKSGDLVVIRPREAKFTIEVKKTLSLRDVDDVINKFTFSNCGCEVSQETGVQFINIFAYKSTAKIERIFERVRAALTKKLNQLIEQGSGDEEKAYLAIQSLTLPRIFFLNSDKFIDCRIRFKNHVGELSLSIDQIPYTTGGASELISRIMWANSNEFTERSHLSSGNLFLPIESIKIEIPIIMKVFLSLKRAIELYPNNNKAVWKMERLKDVIGFMVPPDLKVNKLEDFFKSIKDGFTRPCPK